MPHKVNLAEKLEASSDHWTPRIVAPYNDNEVRLVKFGGEFVWRQHADSPNTGDPVTATKALGI